jgi:hypothetical protein
METSQQRAIIYYFSLKAWSIPTIQKELTDIFASDVYSQAQISRWLAGFGTGGISCLAEARSGRPLSILEPSLEHFWEKFPFVRVPVITMHFNRSHFKVQNCGRRELGLRKFSRRWVSYQLSEAQEKFHAKTSVELFALLYQDSELHFEGIATSDES